jgi:hypothetical protein
MALSNPIEVVVIRDLALRPRSAVVEPPPLDPPPDPAPDPAPDESADSGFSQQQQRDLDGLVDVLHCPVRRSILLNLSTAGKANVKALTHAHRSRQTRSASTSPTCAPPACSSASAAARRSGTKWSKTVSAADSRAMESSHSPSTRGAGTWR